jgi:PKD repeat protein
MKKTTLLALFVLFTIGLWAEIPLSNYAFNYLVTTYTELSSGTSLGNSSSDDQCFTNPAVPTGYGSYATGPGFPIGFDFSFGGVSYDVIGINANGWISLGKSSLGNLAVDMRSSNFGTPLSTREGGFADESLLARIAACGRDLQAQQDSSILLALSGIAPNRVLTVQWKNYRRKNMNNENLNFQIKLSEADMSVGILYGEMTVSAITTLQIGLRSAPANPATNFANRSIASGSLWSESLAGDSVTSAAVLSPTQYPQLGAHFNWAPPLAPQAEFSANPISGNCPLTVQFTDLSIPGSHPISSWHWESNGQTSSLQHPQFIYSNPGTYDVSLTISDGLSVVNETKTGYINVLQSDIPGVNTNITMDGADALVSWDAINTDEHGNSFSPDYYFLYFNGSDDPNGDFYFLAPIAYGTNQYRHIGVGMGAEHMFYKVKAVAIED